MASSGVCVWSTLLGNTEEALEDLLSLVEEERSMRPTVHGDHFAVMANHAGIDCVRLTLGEVYDFNVTRQVLKKQDSTTE